MSIVQVLDPTKTGRKVYVVASTIIVLTSVTIINIITSFLGLASLGALEEIWLVLIPFISGLSLLFMGIKPERSIVERIALSRLYKKGRMNLLYVQMASVLLFMKPWETSPKEAYSIEESLRNDLERTLRGPEFSEQINEFKQIFWIVFLTPLSFVVMADLYSIHILISIIGFIIGLVLAYPFWIQNRDVLSRIAQFAYCRWFHEGVSTDLSRRESRFNKKTGLEGQLKATLEMTGAIIDLVTKGDWKGFDRKIRNSEDLVGLPNPEKLSWTNINSYMELLQWLASEIHGSYSRNVDMRLRNAKFQILDAIEILSTRREELLSSEEESIAKLLIHISEHTSDRDTLLELSMGFFEGFDKETLTKLTASPHILRDLLFVIYKIDKLETSGASDAIDNLANALVDAAEKGVLDMIRVLSLISGWEVHPANISNALGPLGFKTLLEQDVGFKISELRLIHLPIREYLYRQDTVDPELIYQRFEKLLNTETKDTVRRYIFEITDGISDIDISNPISGREALFKFYHDHIDQ